MFVHHFHYYNDTKVVAVEVVVEIEIQLCTLTVCLYLTVHRVVRSILSGRIVYSIQSRYWLFSQTESWKIHTKFILKGVLVPFCFYGTQGTGFCKYFPSTCWISIFAISWYSGYKLLNVSSTKRPNFSPTANLGRSLAQGQQLLW